MADVLWSQVGFSWRLSSSSAAATNRQTSVVTNIIVVVVVDDVSNKFFVCDQRQQQAVFTTSRRPAHRKGLFLLQDAHFLYTVDVVYGNDPFVSTL